MMSRIKKSSDEQMIVKMGGNSKDHRLKNIFKSSLRQTKKQSGTKMR